MEAPNDYELIREELTAIRLDLLKKDADNYGKFMDFADKIREGHPDAHKYELFHLLQGSTARGPVQFFDFPGGDSIENYLRNFE
jgi:hypothetical protein